MRRALVVAHPDDECMWFAGFLLRNPGDWTVICCTTPRRDPIRVEKFFSACEELGAVGVAMRLDEPPATVSIPDLSRLDLSAFDQILTHNEVGEYGHQHHRDVHAYVARHWPKRLITSGYGLTLLEPEGAIVSLSSITLTDEEWNRKLRAIGCYNHTSLSDIAPKWQALIDRYHGKVFDLQKEPYVYYA